MSEELIAAIAIWGATTGTIGLIVSLELAWRAYRRDERRVQIALEWLTPNNFVVVSITNIGFRNITITQVGMLVREMEIWDAVPRNALYAPEAEEQLPANLQDGDQLVLQLSDAVSGALINNDLQARLFVLDAEGNEYTDFTPRTRET